MLLWLLLAVPAAAKRDFGGIVLPPVIYATGGWEGNVYFDSISPPVDTPTLSGKCQSRMTPALVAMTWGMTLLELQNSKMNA
jgi:hypothetical protein